MKKTLKLCGIIALALALLMVLMVALGCGPPEEAVPRSYSCAVYTEQGCAKFVVASGGEIEIQSGGTFDLQSGATVDFSGGVDLDGSTLTFDTDGDTTMVASTDDVITATINSTTTYFVIATGNLKVGNGSPSTSQDGEDAYVEGGFEVDGTSRFDGAIDANSTADIAGNISSSAGAITVTDAAYITSTLDVDGATTLNSSLDVDGNISSGTGAITITDAVYVTSTLDGLADVDIGTWLNLSVQSTLAITEGSTITATGTYQVITSTIACTTSTSTAIANGSETGDLLILRNGNAADAIIVDGTGANVECKANISLGANDTLTLIWNGSDWNCVSSYDNS